MTSDKTLSILGCRGIPASHGGFETFAQQLALFLIDRGWRVIVYCQSDYVPNQPRITRNSWRGVERRIVNVTSKGPLGTVEFDWYCVRDAARQPGICLILGYNTAILTIYLRLRGRKLLTNMDGIEWRRTKWNRAQRIWLRINEWIAVWVSHRLVADHPVIAQHIGRRRSPTDVTMIPYGGSSPAKPPNDEHVRALGLAPDQYLILVARIEPDNNILMIVEAFSRRPRGAKLLVLGTLDAAKPYDRRILDAASREVVFAGAIYDHDVVTALRVNARAYVHGHSVGGTNPSLVEALWAKNAVIAHDNPFNRWTAGEAGLFFMTVDECDVAIDRVFSDNDTVLRARQAAVHQATRRFNLAEVLTLYEREAQRMLAGENEAVVGEVPANASETGG